MDSLLPFLTRVCCVVKSKGTLFLILLPFLIFSPTVQASDWPEGWSQVTSLNPVSINSSRFGLALSQDKELIISWVEGTRSRGNLYLRSFPVQGEPQEPVLVAQGAFFANPVLQLDPENGCHIVWEGRIEGQEVIYYQQLDLKDKGGGEESFQVLHSSPYLLEDVDLILSQETLYLFWSGRDEETMHFDIFMMPVSLLGEPLSAPINLTRTGEISGRNTASIQDGEVHLIWTDYASERFHLFYQSFNLEGEPETAPLSFDTVYNLGRQDRPSLVEGTEEKVLHLLYSGDATAGGLLPAASGLYYARFTSGTLDKQGVILQGSSTMQRPFLGRIEENRLGVLWQDNRGGPLQVHYLQIDEQGEPITEVIPLDVTPRASHAPRMVVDAEGEAYVFWFAFDETGRNYQLSMINTRFPAQPSIWFRIGLDPRHPIPNLLFVLLANILLSLILTFIHIWVYVIPVLLLSLLERRGWLGDPDGFFYPLLLLVFTLLFLLQGVYGFVEPLGPISFQFLGALLASGATLFILQGLSDFSLKSSIHRLSLCLLWLFWFHYFTYLPQVMIWL